MWPFRASRQNKQPITVAFDNNTVMITIRKDWLVRRSATDYAAAGLLRLMGDTDDPENSIADYVAPMLEEIEASALLHSGG
jgi:hypothetical protein